VYSFSTYKDNCVILKEGVAPIKQYAYFNDLGHAFAIQRIIQPQLQRDRRKQWQIAEIKMLRICAGYFAIRPELSGKRRLSWYFTLIISREPPDGQNLSLAARVHQTSYKTVYFSLDHRRTLTSDSQPR